MDSDFNKIIPKIIYGYRMKCADDAKILEDSIKVGDAVSMYANLMKNFNLHSTSKEEKLLHSTRLFFFMGYCLEYNNGIPMLEILSDWIDNSKKRKVVNAVKSQATLCEFLIEKGVDIKILADYIAEKEMIEYAIDEEKKSTGVLKRILARKQLTIKNSIPQQQQQQTILPKPTLSVPDWCIVFYYLDEAGTQQGARIDRIIKFIAENNIRNRNGGLTTKGSFKKQHYEICSRINGTENSKGEQSPPLPPERIKNILPFLKKNKNALQTAKNDMVYLLGKINKNKKNNY